MTDICPKAYFSSPDQWQPVGQELLWTEGGGLHAEIAQSVLAVTFKLVMGGLTSVILIVLSIVNLQFHCQFVPVS